LKIAVRIANILFVALLLLMGTKILEDRYRGSFGPPDFHPFSPGNAPDDVRAAIIATLNSFQDGYTRRDTTRVEEFAQRLLSRDNILILGTMPNEIFINFAQATELVRSDWVHWGDCRFLLDRAHVSAHENVAWFSTVGYVEFDLSDLLVVPLRLSGILVREEGAWQFQHLQFQFDVDLGYLLAINLLLAIWLAGNIIVLLIDILRRARRTDHGLPAVTGD
jgi:hypothetical protein